MNENTETTVATGNMKKHTGGCHCGAVRFEVMVDTSAGSRCNCSIWMAGARSEPWPIAAPEPDMHR